MKFNIPDKHLTISNILMFLTLFAVTGGAIGVVLKQVLMIAITIACLAAFALAIYAIWQVVQSRDGVFVRYEDPTYTEHIHYHYHRIVEQPQQQEQRMIEQQSTRYTVLPHPRQRVLLPQQQHKRIEVHK